jgi:hypothetical protein
MNVKYSHIIVPVTVLFLLSQATFGQGFINLDFESASVSPAPAGYTPPDAYDPVSAGSALPGWTVREDDTVCTAVWGAPVSLDETSVALVYGPFSPIRGNYSLQLSAIADAPPGYFRTSSISQAGLIPAGAQSIRFLVANRNPNLSPQAPPIVTFNAVPISLTTISETGGVLTMAGDVSAFAGSTGTLTFSCVSPGGAFPATENLFNLDEIQFSDQAVPEPPASTLFGVGLAFVIWRLRIRPNQRVQATPGSALGGFWAAWPGAPDPGRSAVKRGLF